MNFKLSKAEIERRLKDSSRDNCINWRGAAIRSGDHVLLERPGEEDLCSFVGQLIDVMDAALVPKGEIDATFRRGKKKRLALVRILPFVERGVASPPTAGENCHLPYSMKEVCQSTSVEWFPVDSVVNICFVFHIDCIQKGLVSCGGMESVFYIRFKKSEGALIPMKYREFNPFYRDPNFPFQESFPEMIWSTLQGLKQQVNKEMSCGGVWDGRTKLAKMTGVAPSFFGYLKYQLEKEADCNMQYNKIRSSRPRKHMFDNFAARQVRINSLVHQIRVLEEWELDVVRKVCGNSFGVGLTVPVPLMKEVKRSCLPMNGTVYMRTDDQVRIVTCRPYEQDLDNNKAKRSCPSGNKEVFDRPTKLRCSYRGLDIRHIENKSGCWELAVQVRFVKVQGNSPAILKAQAVVLSDGAPSDVESEDLEVSVGVYIRIGTHPNLITHVVECIDDNGRVRCRDATDDEQAPVYLSLVEANEL
jgi:hypothetical protein